MKKIVLVFVTMIILVLILVALVLLNLKKDDDEENSKKDKATYYYCSKETNINKYLNSYEIKKIYYDKNSNITKVEESKEYNPLDDIEYNAIKSYFPDCKDVYSQEKKIICDSTDNSDDVGKNIDSYINEIKSEFKCELRDM